MAFRKIFEGYLRRDATQSDTNQPWDKNVSFALTSIMDPTVTQARRDDINLTRLIRRLEKAVNGQKWDDSSANDIWIKSLETLQVCYENKSTFHNSNSLA